MSQMRNRKWTLTPTLEFSYEDREILKRDRTSSSMTFSLLVMWVNVGVNVHSRFYICLILPEGHNNCSFQALIIADNSYHDAMWIPLNSTLKTATFCITGLMWISLVFHWTTLSRTKPHCTGLCSIHSLIWSLLTLLQPLAQVYAPKSLCKNVRGNCQNQHQVKFSDQSTIFEPWKPRLFDNNLFIYLNLEGRVCPCPNVCANTGIRGKRWVLHYDRPIINVLYHISTWNPK